MKTILFKFPIHHNTNQRQKTTTKSKMRAPTVIIRSEHSKCYTTKSPSKIVRRSPQLGFVEASTMYPPPPTSSSKNMMLPQETQSFRKETYKCSPMTLPRQEKQEQICSGILEDLTCLSLDGSRHSLSMKTPTKLAAPIKKRTFYPLIVHPKGKTIDNKTLILERRKVFFQKTLFRSLSLNE